MNIASFSFPLFILVSFSLLSTGCVHVASTSQPIELESASMRVMSFNIRYDNPDDGPDAWPHRKEFVASMFRFHQNDLAGTQEGLIHQLEELDEMLPEFARVGVGRDDGDQAGEYCAIYYRTSRFDLVEHGTFWLSETPDEPGSQSWDAALPRIVTWARLHDRNNDRPFILFNTHFDNRGQEARRKSAILLLAKAADLAADVPVIVMGDLNTTERQDPYRILTEPDRGHAGIELFDGFHHSRYGHHGPTSTWNGFREIVPGRRIDYIFTDSNFTVIQHGIPVDTRDGRFPSDHLPVIADLEFAD